MAAPLPAPTKELFYRRDHRTTRSLESPLSRWKASMPALDPLGYAEGSGRRHGPTLEGEGCGPRMPIKPELRWLYPIDWRELSAAVRFGRARGRRGVCRRPHGATVWRLDNGRRSDEHALTWRGGAGRGGAGTVARRHRPDRRRAPRRSPGSRRPRRTATTTAPSTCGGWLGGRATRWATCSSGRTGRRGGERGSGRAAAGGDHPMTGIACQAMLL
jgi:hypothetical protein